MGFLGLINVRTYTKGSWLRFTTHIIFGSVVCLLTLLVTQKDGEAAFNFAETAWPLPTISLAILIGKSCLTLRLHRVRFLIHYSVGCPPHDLGGKTQTQWREAISLLAKMAPQPELSPECPKGRNAGRQSCVIGAPAKDSVGEFRRRH